MQSLNEKNWRGFCIGEIFKTIRNGTQIPTGAYVRKENLKNGKTPRITVTSNNNGVFGFYDSDDKNYKLHENFISVSFLGDCFYHSYEASIDMKVHCLQPKNFSLNRHIAIFLIKAIKFMTNVFNYGDQLSSTDIVSKKIMLPVDEQGEPDYFFMENYIREIEEKLLQKYLDYFRLPDTVQIVPLNQKTWRKFRLADYFHFTKGNQNNMSDLKMGNIPLVSAKNSNNGYKTFAEMNDKKIFCGHCLTINIDGDGGAGISYYQPADMLLDTHVTALIPKTNLSKESLLFVSRCITIQRAKFGHGYSLNDRRLKVFEIMLPINDAGEPDFEYMGNYMRTREEKILREYISRRK